MVKPEQPDSTIVTLAVLNNELTHIKNKQYKISSDIEEIKGLLVEKFKMVERLRVRVDLNSKQIIALWRMTWTQIGIFLTLMTIFIALR